jgi:hypothetical protein
MFLNFKGYSSWIFFDEHLTHPEIDSASLLASSPSLPKQVTHPRITLQRQPTTLGILQGKMQKINGCLSYRLWAMDT